MSIKQDRLNERIRIILSELLLRDIADPRLQGVTVTEVSIDNELMHATMYVNALGEEEREQEVIEAFKGWEYLVNELDVPSSVNNFSLDSTSTISYANSENVIELRSAKEQYAKNIGLIFKEYKILDTQCISDCIGMTWEEKAEQGFILRMTMIDYN